LSISFTTPEPTNTAQTWIAEANTSGNESFEKAGVSAAAIGAWCCSNSGESSKSKSLDRLKCYRCNNVAIRQMCVKEKKKKRSRET
jgi:hypothetical protein